MRLFLYISDFIVPFMILSILIYGIFAGVNVYDTFIQGAKRGFWTVVRLMPTLIGLMAAVGILRASGLLLDIYKEFGTDSRNGMIASISMACTETIFYTMSVYFMSAKVKKTRYTLAGALIATFAGLAASVWLAALV